MGHIKLFEELANGYLTKDDVEFGDYVIANSEYADKKIQKSSLTHIAKVIYTDEDSIEVEYGDFCIDGISVHTWVFTYDEILHWSKNREDLEEILAGNKYNL